MESNDTAEEKRTAVEHLTFGSKTAKRVSWEAFEFSVAGPHQIVVTNASWGYLKDDHSYVVGVEERNGQPVPAECACKADQYREEYDCKHKVALATVGGSVVLQTAVDYETSVDDTDGTDALTAADKLRSDGGTSGEGTAPVNEVDQECDCTAGDDDFPCATCYIEGRKEFPE